jgi:hypothetical protein
MRHAAAAPLVLIGIMAASLVYPFATRGAVALTFAPTADAYVSSAARSTNFGTATTLKFGASPSQHAYLLFNVQGSSGPIANATLRVWATGAGSAASVHGTTTAWTETGLTYNNAPAYGATLATVSNFAAASWLSYNVTSLVTGNGAVAFMYTSASATPISIASREDPTHAPQLIVTDNGAASALRRSPYLTDASSSKAMVNFATNLSAPSPVVRWGLASGNCTTPPNTVAATSVASFVVAAATDYQYKAPITGLAANTSYCYRVYQSGVDLLGASITFRTAPAPGSSTPYSFAVIGDWGAGTTDEAKVFTQIAAARPNLLLTVGDNAYATGTQADYGDLGGGKVFGPQYLPRLGGGTPIFAAQGNHGFTSYSAYLQNFPQNATAAASGGAFSAQSYCCAGGTSGTRTYASSWYAFTWGNARFYVLEAAWADANGAYQGDFTDHWNGPVTGCAPCGQQKTWLTNDLAANASVPVKFAFFHYPLYAEGSQPSDSYLQGPSGLEGLLASYKVGLVFNGHAHHYERNKPMIAGSPMVSYVTGGGGDTLGSLGGCSAFDAYAVGRNSSCRAPLPTSDAQVFHYLLVRVNGNQVTVTPTDETGRTFDIQTYTFGGP